MYGRVLSVNDYILPHRRLAGDGLGKYTYHFDILIELARFVRVP
jgi:hypothetical protein